MADDGVLDADGEPFCGGTYFPKPQFLQLLDALDDVWRNRRDDLEQNAEALVDAAGRTPSAATPTRRRARARRR